MPVIPGTIVQASNKKTGAIEKSKLLLVEGKDETVFFEALYKKNQILNGKFDDIQIIETGGVEKFRSELPALLNRTGFADNVESIAIIRDADQDFASAFQSVCGLLSTNNLPCPPEHGVFTKDSGIKVGVFIMPGSPDGGIMLEDLCLHTQSTNPIITCIDSFFGCLQGLDIEMPRNLPKAKAQVFLASMPKIVNSLGLGALKGYWDLNHDSLTGLCNFLNEV